MNDLPQKINFADFEPEEPKVKKEPNAPKGKRGPKPGTMKKIVPPSSLWQQIVKLSEIWKVSVALFAVISSLLTFLWSIGLAPVTNGKLNEILTQHKIEFTQEIEAQTKHLDDMFKVLKQDLKVRP